MIKKKIAHLIATNFYGGPEKQIIEHLKRVGKQAFSSLAISFIEKNDRNEFLVNAELNQIKNIGIQMNGPLDFNALLSLLRIIKREKIDLLCVHGYKSVIFGLIAAKKNNIPIVGFSRGYTAENLKIRFYEWLDRKFLNYMDGIVSVSHGQEYKLKALNVRSPQMWVVHNSVSIPSPKRTINEKEIFRFLDLPQHSKLILSAGRLSPEKGHRYLIEAISQIPKIPDDYYFIICGDGVCLPELKKRAKELGIIEKCRFPGFLKNVQDLFAIMEFMVLPSLTEGLPNVVLEAFSYSKAVVSTSVGGVPELVDDNKNGLLVPHSDPTALANSIEKLIQNQELANEFGEKGYLKVKDQFNFELQAEKLQNIYQAVLSQYA